jgi:hypothetical protein
MEMNDIEEVIKELETIGKQKGIEIFRIGSSFPSAIPAIQLADNEYKGIAETDLDAIFEVGNFMRLAERLEIKAIFYQLDSIERNDKKAYNLNLYLLHTGVYFTSKIISSNYFKILDEIKEDKSKEMKEKLNTVRDALKIIFTKNHFDADQFVKDSFLPFLEINGIDYRNEESFKADDIIKLWFAEVSGIENISTLVDELVDYYVGEEKDYESEVYGLKLLEQLVSLGPYMYNNIEGMMIQNVGAFLSKIYSQHAHHLRYDE